MEKPPSLSPPRHAGRLGASERAAAVPSRICAAPGRPASVRVPRPRFAIPKPLTCSRVARECTAPGAAWAPELAALAQLFLLVLPPPALSHRRGAEAQPRDSGLAPSNPTPAPSRGPVGGPGRKWQRRLRRRLRNRQPLRTPPAAGWGEAGAGRAGFPASSSQRRGLFLPAFSPTLFSLPLSLPRPAPPRGLGAGDRAGSGRASPSRGGVSGCPQPHTLEPPAGPKQTCTK